MPESYENPSPIAIGPFTIYPDKFFLKKGNSITLDIEFNPSDEGKFTDTFIFGCDNLKTYEFTISAEANKIELAPTAINGCNLTPDCHPFRELHFREVEYRNPVQKTMEIENLTKNKISYEWRKRDKNNEFQIEAAQGEFGEREKRLFTVTYFAKGLEASYADIDLVIKNIPLESVKNPPPHIKEMIRQAEELSPTSKGNQKIEFVYFSLRLFGEVNTLQWSVSPEFLRTPVMLPLDHKHTARFTIKNHNKSTSTFSLKEDHTTNPAFKTRVIGVYKSAELIEQPSSPIDPKDVKRKKTSSKPSITYGITRKSPSKVEPKQLEMNTGFPHPDSKMEYIEVPSATNGFYPIQELQELDFYIEYWCDIPLSDVQATYLISYSNSYTRSVDIVASFQGTKLRICASDVYFGVVKSFATDEREFEIENYSEVDAEVLVKCQKHKTLDLTSKLS